jgi:uncharacterized protein (TIGR02421 family)
MPTTRPKEVTQAFVEAVRERWRQNKQVRRRLPVWGRLHVDRQLPFVFVYRRPPDAPGRATEKLLLGEASYLLVPAGRNHAKGLSLLLEALVEETIAAFGACLVVEVWSRPESAGKTGPDGPHPRFRLLHWGGPQLATTVRTFEEALRGVRVRSTSAAVEVSATARVAPPDLEPLFSPRRKHPPGVELMGVEVEAIYESGDGRVFPILLRELHREFSTATKKALFGFAQTRTTHRPAHYHSLGRRALVKATWSVDRQLAEVSNRFEFLLSATPVNARQAYSAFERSRFEKAPRFVYRPLSVAPVELKRQLYAAPIENVEDPQLERLFREKQYELDCQLTGLLDRDTPRFLYSSLQIYPGVDESLLKVAEDLLYRVSSHARERRGAYRVDARAFAARARKEIAYFRKRYPEIRSEVEITPKVTGLMVSRGRLLIAADLSVPSSRVEALIQHEVGTHILTHVNGSVQPFRLLNAGLAGYDELQEGLAVLTEYLVNGLSPPRVRLLAARVVAVHRMVEGATFVETFRELERNYEFSRQTAFTLAMRVFRGGGLTKDACYLRGLVRLIGYLRKGGEFEPLLTGKISADHVATVNELMHRKVLREPPLRPRYLDDEDARARLQLTREKGSVLDLLARRRKR